MNLGVLTLEGHSGVVVEKVDSHPGMLRARVPQFEPKSTGDTEYARNWLAKYDWHCNTARCSEEVRMRDVALRMEGSAFPWFVSLPQPAQKSWQEFSKAFFKKFACGLTSSESASKALKDLYQCMVLVLS